MKKILSLIFIIFTLIVQADEGMWLPLLLEKYNEADMQKKGLKLSAEDIYSVNNASLKDAVVLFGRGCTGAIISSEGLLITNHHCGKWFIQNHSTIEQDYLTNGFWAMTKQEELPNPSLTVTILERMEDVTEQVLKDVTADMTEFKRNYLINEAIKKIQTEAVEGTHYIASVKPFFSGNQYFLFVMEVFKDVRLVGAPPLSIGNFGGDTDNWLWPRHTGDFVLFRIYTNKENKPAEYSPENIPYKPKKHLKISLNGYRPDEFTMVYGFPGRTQEYAPSYAVGFIYQTQNPALIKIRATILKIMEKYMRQNDTVKFNYFSRYASISNYWKKWIGENAGLKRLDAIEKKREFEQKFQQWTNENPERKQKYGNLLSEYQKIYKESAPIQLWEDYFYEAIMQIEIISYADKLSQILSIDNDSIFKERIEKFKNNAKSFFKKYNTAMDKEIFTALIKLFYESIEKKEHPDIYHTIEKKFKGDFNKYADYVYKKSFITSEEKVIDFLSNYKPKKDNKFMKDPVYRILESFSIYYKSFWLLNNNLNTRLDSLNRVYMRAIMEMQSDKIFYPDANGTLRISYGKIEGYNPRDAVYYDYFTTLEGILQKEDDEIYDYKVPEKLKELYKNMDYGKYCLPDGRMPVCFIASNHTSGGNSGSPVLNAEGHLIGVNFDRNWEGTMSDLFYDPAQCRNIILDIRYCLFIIDKFAGAKNLLQEMEVVE